MEELKSFNLKAFFFYFFKSWRVLLICLILSTAIALGATFANPPSVREASISEREYKQLVSDFLTSDEEGKLFFENRELVRKNNYNLRRTLSEDLYFQIDPTKRMNKSFVLNFKFAEDVANDVSTEARTARILSLRYMQALQDESFVLQMVEKGRVPLNEVSIRHLIHMEINSDGLLFVEVTGPDESLIDAILYDIRDYTEVMVHADIDPMGDYMLMFTDERVDIVEDPGILQLREELERMIALGEARIEEIDREVELAVNTKHKLVSTPGQSNEVKDLSTRTLVKRALMGFFVGLLISIFWTLIRYWKEIGEFDVKKASYALNLLYLGVLPMDTAIDKDRRGNALDLLIARCFKRAYDASEAETAMAYTAELIIGKVNAMIANNTVTSTNLPSQEASLQLLVPGTETDRVRTQLIEQLQVVFDKTVVPGAITLKPIGSFAGDPTAFQSMQKTSALLYLWSNNDTTEKRMLEYQLGRHLNFPVIGVVEACAMY